MVKFIKEQYPKGTRIRLNSMEDPYAPIASGTEGEVNFVDDSGTLHMKWDNGRSLAIIPGEDSFSVLPPKLTTLKLYMPLTADLYEPNEYGDLDDNGVTLDGAELRDYAPQISAALLKNRMPEEAERGLMHYPPRYRGYACSEILALLKQYGVTRCYYGHLHADSIRLALEDDYQGVQYRLVSADHVDFQPQRIG